MVEGWTQIKLDTPEHCLYGGIIDGGFRHCCKFLTDVTIEQCKKCNVRSVK